MKLEIRKANRLDFERLSFLYEEPPVMDNKRRDFFDEVLCQTGYSLLIAEADGEIAGVLGVSIIEGLGKKYPVAVLSGGKLGSCDDREKIGDALIMKAKELAQRAGCKAVIS